MTKEECEKALNALYDENDEMEDYASTFSFDDNYIPQCAYERARKYCFEVLNQLIKEHFDNPPLIFEELTEMVGFPVWDDKEKMWFIVSETFKPFSFYFPIYEDALSIKLVNNEYCSLIITNNFEYHKKFEENRFYRRQKEDLR